MTTQRDTPELQRLLQALSTASKVTRYYPPGHPQIEEALGKILARIVEIVSKGSPLSLKVEEEGLVAGGSVVTRFTPGESLFSHLRDLGVRELVLNPGVDEKELLSLVEVLGREPKRTWEEGGLARALRQRKVAHVAVVSLDLGAAERQALLESFRFLTPDHKARVAELAKAWLAQGERGPTDEEVIEIVALLREAEGLRMIVPGPGPGGYPASQMESLVRLWSLVAKSGLQVPAVEAELASEVLTTDARTLMEVACTERPGVMSLSRLLERLDPRDAADLIADHADPRDVAGWISVVEKLVRPLATRRSILYRWLQRWAESDRAAEALAVLEDHLASWAREEAAFLSLMRGACSQVETPPASWQGRWQGGILVRRATGVLERVGVSEPERMRWLSQELDRMVKDGDVQGVLEVLEVIGERHDVARAAEGIALVSETARTMLPGLLASAEGGDRLRALKALQRVDRSWQDLVAAVVEAAEPQARVRVLEELERMGVAFRDLILDLMRSERPEEIAQGVRLTTVSRDPQDVPILLGFLQHGNPSIRMEAIAALGVVAPEQVLDRLCDIMRDSNPLVAVRTLEVLADCPGAASRLAKCVRAGLLRAVPQEVGLAVVEYIRAWGSEQDKAEVIRSVRGIRALGRPIPREVKRAVESLARTPEESAGQGESEGE